MVLDREVERARLAPAANLGVGMLVGADRHAVVRQVRQAHQQRGDLGLQGIVARGGGGQRVAQPSHLGHHRRHVLALGLQLADLL